MPTSYKGVAKLCGKIIEYEYARMLAPFLSSLYWLADGRYQKFDETLATDVQSFHTHSGDIRRFFQRHFADVADLVDLRSTEGILGGGLDAKLAEADSEVVRVWADLMF